MRPLSEAASSVTNDVFGRKYVALGRIISQWNEIVGEDLSTKAQPVALKYKNFKDKSGKIQKNPDATLEIATTSAHATRLHYQKDLILERINRIFGERWITAIRFVNVPSNAPERPKMQKVKELSVEEKNYISETLDYITDIEVRNRLENFGKALMLDSKKDK